MLLIVFLFTLNASLLPVLIYFYILVGSCFHLMGNTFQRYSLFNWKVQWQILFEKFFNSTLESVVIILSRDRERHRERENTSRGGAETEGLREFQAGSALPAQNQTWDLNSPTVRS